MTVNGGKVKEAMLRMRAAAPAQPEAVREASRARLTAAAQRQQARTAGRRKVQFARAMALKAAPEASTARAKPRANLWERAKVRLNRLVAAQAVRSGEHKRQASKAISRGRAGASRER